jgi:hypothetical protein
MNDLEQKSLALNQQGARLASKVAPLIMASALLQEAMNLNQQLTGQINALTDALKHEREAKSPDRHGGEVPSEARPSA